jgi:hypothetical protein
MRDWVTNVRSTHYILGTAYGSHPYPMMVRDFNRVIGQEAKEQILAREGRLPDELIACVGGGSNAIGLFFEFLEDTNERMIGVEAGGHGIKRGEHAAPRCVFLRLRAAPDADPSAPSLRGDDDHPLGEDAPGGFDPADVAPLSERR